MKIYRSLILVGVLGLFLINSNGYAQALSKGISPQYTEFGESHPPGLNPNAPVLLNAYAIDRGVYGTTLKIYLEAEDPSGEMAKIATTVDQPGYGHYPTDFIILKPGYRKDFKGYVQWNTFSSHISTMGEWVRVYVTVAVIDKAGKTSNEFVFPFSFETGVAPAPKPPVPFDQGDLPKLGNVAINLFDPFHMGSGSRDDRN